MVLTWLAVAALAGSSFPGSQHGKSPTPPGGRRPTTWQVAVAVALGKATVEEHYTLRTTRVSRGVWAFATLRSEKLVEDSDGTRRTWSSETAGPGDPWPYVLQQAVAAVPAAVRLENARPTELVDPDGWSAAARAALEAVALPPDAVATGASLVDPQGVVRDLARAFPGLPTDGRLVARDRIAGVDAVREEVCGEPEGGAVLRYRCAGTARAADGSDRLAELETWTEVVADRDGLVWMESAWSGILVTPDGAGRHTALPVAGHRRVQRQQEAGS